MADVLTLQNQVAHDVAQHVAVTIRPDEEQRFVQPRPVQPGVAEAYIKGQRVRVEVSFIDYTGSPSLLMILGVNGTCRLKRTVY